MADELDNAEDGAEEVPGGSLADAIAAHLALKQEHGADPDEVGHELEDALSPPIREEESATAAEPEPEPEPAPEPEPTPTAEEPRPGEISGTIEFEFGEEDKEPEPQIDEASEEGDLLEATPDFFEETPEHDKLWFDEAPPRKFDF